jgi:hypothetical protein
MNSCCLSRRLQAYQRQRIPVIQITSLMIQRPDDIRDRVVLLGFEFDDLAFLLQDCSSRVLILFDGKIALERDRLSNRFRHGGLQLVGPAVKR